jgi:hypothetical protein
VESLYFELDFLQAYGLKAKLNVYSNDKIMGILLNRWILPIDADDLESVCVQPAKRS